MRAHRAVLVLCWCAVLLQLVVAEGLPVTNVKREADQDREPLILWGPHGHMSVAAVAMQLVKPCTAIRVQNLVGDLRSAAAWPDEVKREKASYKWSKPLHYTNTKPWARDYKESDCHKGRCIVTAISNYTARVADQTLPKAQRSEALKFLSHFVGDIHQPLHVGFARDRGGNDIKGTWMGDETNLHKVWDFHVVDRRLRHGFPQTGISGFARHLAAQHTKDRTSAEHTRCDLQSASACPNAWAVEAAVLASTVGYKDRHDEVIRNGFRFAHEEYMFLLPIIEKQITKGGVRLARLLDQLLGSCKDGSAQQNKGRYEEVLGFEASSEETSVTEDSADTATEEDSFVEQDPPPKSHADEKPGASFQPEGLQLGL